MSWKDVTVSSLYDVKAGSEKGLQLSAVERIPSKGIPHHLTKCLPIQQLELTIELLQLKLKSYQTLKSVFSGETEKSSTFFLLNVREFTV